MGDKIFGEIFGGIIGLCVADALGVPVEFKSRETLMNSPVTDMRGYGTYNQPSGTWSDDTSLTLCLLDSLAYGLDYQDIMQKFLLWYNKAEYTPHGEVFDIGGSTHAAIMNFAKGTAALNCGGTSEYDNGNGSLMRILPLAFYLRERYGSSYTDSKEAFDVIHNVSALTHAHKRSQIACGIYLSVAESFFVSSDIEDGVFSGVSKAKHHYDNSVDFAEELQHYNRIFKDNFADLQQEDIKSSGYVVDTLEAALWCLLNTHSYQHCVLRAVNLGGDTDTVAAIAGGLAGLYYRAIPENWVNQIPRLEYIKQLCSNFYSTTTR
ncbi:MAG: ADP-ribosylglycohydrolase family protein [Defluviitaleaceae bacterium]|nr:ADP-ribosylglycohydrolase family protein [Defluviitaleaceae bacterium]